MTPWRIRARIANWGHERLKTFVTMQVRRALERRDFERMARWWDLWIKLLSEDMPRDDN